MKGGLAARFLQSLRHVTAAGGVAHAPGPPGGVFPKGQDKSLDLGLGLAVSGGGDSMAMLHLAVEAGLAVQAVTVDHGLRPEAADEAAEVGRICAGLGLRHEILRWHWDGQGNLQDAARRGRRRLIAEWAGVQGIEAVALAHTRDDVAETFLMRMARGAGVDGLAAMAASWHEGGVTWLRPLLAVSRMELRDYLGAHGLSWVEDPSNANERFDRVKARKALVALGPLGLTAERLAEVAGYLAEARVALDALTLDVWGRVVSDHGLGLVLDMVRLAQAPGEVQRRVLIKVILRLAPGDYAPRGSAIQALLARISAGKDGVLAGCRFQWVRGRLWAFREARAVASQVALAGQVWDGLWRIEGPAVAGAQIRALGAGIAHCATWRASGLPRAAVLASPSLWQDATLIAAPHAGFGPGYSAKPLFDAAALHHSVISH